MTDKIVVLSTCNSEEEARTIARGLVERRLAACVQVTPGIRSVYQWQGKVEEADEFLLVIKSRRDLFDRLQEELRRMHSYDVPEVVALPAVDGSADYLKWLDPGVDAAGAMPATVVISPGRSVRRLGCYYRRESNTASSSGDG